MVADFARTQPFPLDPFQAEAAGHLADGLSVLVAAPTGTGKTVVAEFAIWQARQAGKRAIYTAPIKALSNQKFRDLRARHGEREVGLLTGDIVENPTAPIVVMTTEIYRNMLLEGCRAARTTPQEEAEALVAPVARRWDTRGVREGTLEAADAAALARQAQLDEELSGVSCVIFDELHYLSDPERGPVWEEAIIHSPAHVLFAGLSATVSNADELRRWIEHVHGPMALVFHDERAVPLEHYFFLDGELHLVRNAAGKRVKRFPNIGGEAKLARLRGRGRRYTFGDEDEASEPRAHIRLSEQATRMLQANAKSTDTPAHPAANAETAPKAVPKAAPQPEEPHERAAPEPGEVITALRKAGLLPCLYFLPGRRAVEAAASSAAKHLLVSPEVRARLHEEVQEWLKSLPAEDRKLDQVQRLAALLPRGLGFHHAGLLPALKVMVEMLFARGDLRAVFATDTLALGINMPARAVVVGSLSKFDGTQMRLLTPNEYQQLTGRAGRRGMDAQGTAVLLYSPWDVFEPAFAQLTAPLLPVTSAFSVRYNTVLNLWRPGDMDRLKRAVAASLREFQRRDRGRFREREERARYGRRDRRPRDPFALGRAAAAELYATVDVLRYLDYIDRDDQLSVRGHLLRSIFHPAGMVIVELLLSGALDDLGAAEVAEVLSWFTYDGGDRTLRNLFTLSQRLQDTRRVLWRMQRVVQDLEFQEGVTLSPGIVESFHSVALSWWRGTTLGGLLRRIELAEGDLLVSLNQTIDLIQQVQSAVGQTVDEEGLWAVEQPDSKYGRALRATRARLVTLRPALAQAWQGMLRGSVAMSRAIPSMTTPTAEEPALAMAEDEDSEEVRLDRLEQPAT
jgi:superfamily II RNA helicase